MAALALVLVTLTASPAGAMTDEDIYGALRFPFNAPGGRASAMGGAGVALVDDSSAARFNPARLASINTPEFVVEAGRSSYASTFTSSGLIRFDPSVNPFAGMSFETTSSAGSGTTPAYLSFAYPLKVGGRPLVVALSRTEVLNLDLDARSLNRTTPLSAPVAPGAGDEVVRISRGTLDADLELYDFAAGWRLTPTFSVGGSLVAGRLRLSSETVGLLADPLQFTGPGMSDPRFSGTMPAPLSVTRSSGSDMDFAFSFASWWRPHHTISVAAVYRQGARFGIPSTSRNLSTSTSASFSNVVSQPDTAVVGVAWTPFDRNPSAARQSLVFTLDLERVAYSDLLRGMRAGENVLTRSDFVRKVSYTASDATEAHLGMEFRRSFPSWTLALRGGLYTRQDGGPHLDRASGDVGALQGQSRAMKQGDFFRDRGTEWHETLGAGARFYSFSLDVAADLSDSVDRVVASLTYHLERDK